jgi:hypothetical protein
VTEYLGYKADSTPRGVPHAVRGLQESHCEAAKSKNPHKIPAATAKAFTFIWMLLS